MGSKPKMPAPTTPDYTGATNKLLGTYTSTTPGVQAFEASARPGYTGLNLGDIASFLGGAGGQQGYVGQVGEQTAAAQQQLAQARAAEYGGMTAQAGQVRGLLETVSPEARRMMQLQQAAAEKAYASAEGLTGQEARGAQQAAREASMARGNIGSTGSIASEILNRENVLASKRAQAAEYGNRAYQTAQNFYAPTMQLLSGTPAAMGIGQQYANVGLSQIGQAAPKLFDYSTGFGMEQANVKAQDAYNQARYQQKLKNYQSTMGMVGTIGGAAVGTMFGNPMLGASIGGALTGSPSAGLATSQTVNQGFSMPSFLGGGSGGYLSGIGGGNAMGLAASSGAY